MREGEAEAEVEAKEQGNTSKKEDITKLMKWKNH